MSETKRKPVVGESLYIVGCVSYTKHNTGHGTVTRVGRKYFYMTTKGFLEKKFHIDTWRQSNKGYAPSVSLYESEDAYNCEQNKEALIKEIRDYFQYSNDNILSLDQLNKISEIIKGE